MPGGEDSTTYAPDLSSPITDDNVVPRQALLQRMRQQSQTIPIEAGWPGGTTSMNTHTGQVTLPPQSPKMASDTASVLETGMVPPQPDPNRPTLLQPGDTSSGPQAVTDPYSAMIAQRQAELSRGGQPAPQPSLKQRLLQTLARQAPAIGGLLNGGGQAGMAAENVIQGQEQRQNALKQQLQQQQVARQNQLAQDIQQAQLAQAGAQATDQRETSNRLQQDMATRMQQKPTPEEHVPAGEMVKDANGNWVQVGEPKQPAGDKPTFEEQEYEEWKGQQKPGAPNSRMAFEMARKQDTRPPASDTASNNRLDRSYQYNATALTNERKPVEAQMTRISSALSNLNLQSPQADAVLAPQVLTISAGGIGSGIRMNDAEISRIIGGATVWTQLQTKINKFSTDPAHAAFTPEQRGQMAAILQAANQKGQMKQQILEQGDQALIGATDVNGHRSAVADTRKLLDAVDQGKRLQRNRTTGEYRVAPDAQ